MKNLSIAIWISTFCSSLLLSCGTVKEAEFRNIENVRMDQFGLKESTLTLDLLFLNPNNFRVKLKKMEGDVWIDEKLLGHFLIDTLIHIPARANFRLPVKLKANMNQLLKNSLAALLNKEVLLKVAGFAKVGKGLVFIRYPIRYEKNQKFADLLK
ncbi:MAG: LEA type 2 family protein [Chitinophagaceae bacterium]|nr:LEA type 2 family protein [Chitinophagaceae bacterium]